MYGVVITCGYFGTNGGAGQALVGSSIVEIISGNTGSGSGGIRTVDPSVIYCVTCLTGWWCCCSTVVIASHTRKGIVSCIACQIGSIMTCAVSAGIYV